MDEKFTQSAACAGDCASCGSDCGIDVNQPTVTLTLEDDSEVVCAVLNIFSAPNDREYIALLPLDEDGKKSGRRSLPLPLFRDRKRSADARKHRGGRRIRDSRGSIQRTAGPNGPVKTPLHQS